MQTVCVHLRRGPVAAGCHAFHVKHHFQTAAVRKNGDLQ